MTDVLRVAAVADLHCRTTSAGMLAPLFFAVAGQVDVLLLAGDLTDYGRVEEARILARELGASRVPVLAVLGNHDHEGAPDDVSRILLEAGVTILDGSAHEIGDVGFVGTKGFAGGFGEHALQPWGESCVKHFVHEAADESLKLESALARLQTRIRVALLHYAPVRETVAGEPLEIYPFLGSTRLEEPLNRYGVTAVFHGHAHHGRPDGRTTADIPVYNVALPVLRDALAGRPPVRVVDIPLDGAPG